MHPDPDKARLIELAGRFAQALDRVPWIAERVAAGQQFNCYETASDDDDDEPDDDRDWLICIGPITDARSLGRVHGRWQAELVESALKMAALKARSAS